MGNTATTSFLEPAPGFESTLHDADIDDAAIALLNGFIDGTLRRVKKLIRDGLPPLGSTAAFYERISDDREGEKAGVTRQRTDNEEQAAADGVTVPEQARFRDNDLGASPRSKKPRPDFERLLAYIATGQVRTVYAYSNSRLTRRPMELELLIRMHESTKVRYVTKVSGSDDLSTSDGRMVARIKAAVDAAEAERTAERIARAAKAKALEGSITGSRRPFGWGRDDKPWKEQTPAEKAALNPTEAALIRVAVERLLAGKATLGTISREWEAEGIKTIMGGGWTKTTVSQMLRNPRLAGWRVYQGKVLADPTTGEWVRAQFEPLLSQDTYERLQVLLGGHSETKQKMGPVSRRGSRKYLLSGLTMCAQCRRRMSGRRLQGVKLHRYVCIGGASRNHVMHVSGAVDALVTKAVLGRYETMKADADASEPEFEGDARLAQVKQMLAELEANYLDGSGSVSGDRYWRMSAALEAERDALQQARERFIHATVGPPIAPVTPEMWEAMTLGEQRARIERVVEAVIVKPSATRFPGPKFDKERVEIVWR